MIFTMSSNSISMQDVFRFHGVMYVVMPDSGVVGVRASDRDVRGPNGITCLGYIAVSPEEASAVMREYQQLKGNPAEHAARMLAIRESQAQRERSPYFVQGR